MHKRFILTYIGACLLTALPFLMNLAVSWRAGEFMSVDEIVAMQSEQEAIYGCAMSSMSVMCSLKRIEQDKPDVIAVGSSRSLEFREEFFSSSFVNAGGSVGNIYSLKPFLKVLFELHKPKMLVLSVDPWWFNDAVPAKGLTFEKPYDKRPELSTDHLLNPMKYVLNSKIEAAQYMDLLTKGMHTPNEVTASKGIGLAGILWSDGFRKDGSRLYGKRLFFQNDIPPGFQDTLRFVRDGIKNFQPGRSLSEERIAAYEDVLRFCEEQGVPVAAVVVPLAKPVLDAMLTRNGEYDYLSSVEQYFTGKKDHFYFLAPESIGAIDCEFLDGSHPGDVIYQRVLLAAAKDSTLVADFIRRDKMREVVDQFAGRPMSYYEKRPEEGLERDYLGLGCQPAK
ncbi:hypothetical protein [Pseudodesulfovibrio sp. zrk46]|uniref:hypothetical protein n=1 Tax=Pseudodesulfovibrio sp. zrk46 TaxID=2725288 RepID=UPI00144995AA|nr:hypothetical protein [Pseudodesulfovibrio sp. zrk46]QJB56591.1 hypothetical protein HFN16_09295 [Pseudodesulfovibrio sp. zrk46]